MVEGWLTMVQGDRACELKELKVELTYQCRLRCIHCSSGASPSNRLKMARGDALRILEEAADMGVEQVAFSGGEPLLWTGLSEAISLCCSAGIGVSVYTSGNIPGTSEAMLMLKSGQAAKVIFTVYAADSDCHDRITNTPGSFRRTMHVLKKAVKVRLCVELHFVPMQTNFEQLPAVVELAKKLGASRVSLLRFVPQGRGGRGDALALTHDQNMLLQEIVLTARKRANLRARSPYNFLLINESPECNAAHDRLTVTPDMRIHPCDAFKQLNAETIVGTDQFSRLDKWSLRECWEASPYLGKVREYLNTPFEAPCKGCHLLKNCLSGCLAQKYIAYGELRKCPDPMCLLGRARGT
jgi:pyrroloquinoline quinone biosynthesis protein E